MPMLSGVVARYDVAMTSTNGSAVPRLSLYLDVLASPRIDVVFVGSITGAFVTFTDRAIEVQLERAAFADTYHVLQTERPLFVTVRDLQFAGRPLRGFTLSTSEPEPIGEGDHDASAEPTLRPPPGIGPDPAPKLRP
jgi:hypothetical protein